MNRLRTLLLASLIVVWAAPAQAKGKQRKVKRIPKNGWALPPGSPGFLVHKGKFCRIKTSLGQPAAKDIAGFVDHYLRAFRKLFKGKFKIPGPLTVVVFAHSSEFLATYKKTYKREGDVSRPALYAVHLKQTWVLAKGKGKRRMLPLETMKHELTHQLLHFFTGRDRLPPWFNEGAACFFQYWIPSQSNKQNILGNLERAKTGDFGYFPRVVSQSFGKPSWVPLKRLLRLDYQQFHRQVGPAKERVHYSESWALINFLTTSKAGRKFFNLILKGLRAGKNPSKTLSAKVLKKLRVAWHHDLRTRILPASR